MDSHGILGTYTYQMGGTIHLNMGHNMELGVAGNTFFHEIQHLHLSHVSQLGFAISMLEIERLNSEKNEDIAQSLKMHLFTEMISQRIVKVHEIYANNMELLFIQETEGKAAFEKSLRQRPPEYQSYYYWMADINQDTSIDTLGKKQCIHLLCTYAISPEIGRDSFIDVLKLGKQALGRYFEGENHPYTRLQYALNCYKRKSLDDLSFFTLSDRRNFLKKVQQHQITKYATHDFGKILGMLCQPNSEEEDEIIDLLSISGPIDTSSDALQYTNSLSNQCKVFDILKFKIYRGVPFGERRDQNFLVVKNSINLDNPKENVYLIGYVDIEGTAVNIAVEATSDELIYWLRNKSFVAVLYEEYDHLNSCPCYFNSQAKPLFVLIDTFERCRVCLQRTIKAGDICIGDLYDENTNNFFTVLFFRSANHPEVIFVYPTLKLLALKIVHQFKLKKLLCFSNSAKFNELFKSFGNNDSIQQALEWLFGMFTNIIGKFPSQESFSDSPNNLISTLSKHSKVEHKPRLPDEKTVGCPFYAIMQYNDGHNTGNIHVDANRRAIFFSSRQQAIDYLSVIFKSDGRVVGIGKRYWETIKKNQLSTSILICLNAISGEAVMLDGNSVDALIGMNEQELLKSLQK